MPLFFSTFSALKVMFYNSMYRRALYEPLTVSQIISCTSDGTIIFWNASDGTRIREIKTASTATQQSPEKFKGDASLNDLQFLPGKEQRDIDSLSSVPSDQIEEHVEEMFQSQRFITGGADRTVKVYCPNQRVKLNILKLGINI